MRRLLASLGKRSQIVRGIVETLFGEARGRAGMALALLLAGSVTEGFTILLLVPLLQLIGPEANGVTFHLPRWLPPPAGGMPVELALAPVLVLLVVLVSGQALFNRFRTIYTTQLLHDGVSRLRLGLFEAIGRARWQYIASVRGSDLHHAVTSDVDRINMVGYNVLLLVQDVILLAAYLVLSALISPAMTLFAFLTGAIVFGLLAPVRRRASAFGRTLTENHQMQSRTVSEFLGGLKFAKSMNIEPRFLAQMEEALAAVRADLVRYLRASSYGSVGFQVASAIVLSVFVFVGLKVARLGQAELIVLVFLFSRIAPRFTSIQSDIQEILVNSPAFENVERLRAACMREREEPAGTMAATLPPLSREIRLEDVSFGYGERTDDILREVSLTLPAGEITALIGHSGSGKTTLADLVMGLIEPRHGGVRVDGTVLGAGQRRAWRDQIAYVPQDVAMLHDTIAGNLRLGAADRTDDELWDALRASSAEDFVRRLPQGLDTIVGDRGLRLSGGERQRIALARALLRRPRLLVLDEATSALDWENQALIARSIEALRGRLTILTIAHRPSMIAFADRVAAIENGRIIEQGPYRDLAADPRSYLALMLAGERRVAG